MTTARLGRGWLLLRTKKAEKEPLSVTTIMDGFASLCATMPASPLPSVEIIDKAGATRQPASQSSNERSGRPSDQPPLEAPLTRVNDHDTIGT